MLNFQKLNEICVIKEKPPFPHYCWYVSYQLLHASTVHISLAHSYLLPDVMYSTFNSLYFQLELACRLIQNRYKREHERMLVLETLLASELLISSLDLITNNIVMEITKARETIIDKIESRRLLCGSVIGWEWTAGGDRRDCNNRFQ